MSTMEILRKLFGQEERKQEVITCNSEHELLRLGELRPEVQATIDVFLSTLKELKDGIAIGGATPEDTQREKQIFDNAKRGLAEHGVMVEKTVLELL